MTARKAVHRYGARSKRAVAGFATALLHHAQGHDPDRGYRLQAHIRSGKVKLFTCGGLDWTARLGITVPADLSRLSVQIAILDGEIVAESAAHSSNFSALHADMASGRTDRLAYYAFDLLWLDGYDLRRVTGRIGYGSSGQRGV